MNKKSTNLLLVFAVLILLSIPLILPYFTPGYFPTHDGEWAVVRAVEMFREVRDMQFPPRYSGVLNFEYGYPLFNFAYPFPYYLSLLLHLLGFSFIASIKFLFAVSIPLSAIFMYLASKKIWNSNLAGILSGVLYIYVPYRMVDLYVRGSLGESISFILFPLILYLLLVFIENKKIYSGLLAGIFFAVLVLTHNIMAVYFLLLLGLFFISSLLIGNRRYLKPFMFFGLIGIAVSCYFWLPALFEKQYILLSRTPIANRDLYYPTLQELLIPSWGYGGPTSADGFSYQLGIPLILTLLSFISFIIYKLYKKQTQSRSFIFICGVLVILFFLLSPVSKIVWEHSPLLSEINYPWTLLGPIAFLAALGSGILSNGKSTKYFLIMLTVLSIVLVLPYAKPIRYDERSDAYYITNDATTTSSNELMPLWVKRHPSNKPEKKVITEYQSSITDEAFKSNRFSFNITSPSKQSVVVNRLYYPGWSISVNNQEVPVSYENDLGVMSFTVPQGNSSVKAVFEETPLRLTADLISLFSILAIGIIFYKRKLFEQIILK